MATIGSENAKQIRDPMKVHIEMILAETTKVTSGTPLSDYKSYDNTFMQTGWPMRVLADLQGDGFILDGSAEWYEEKTASESNGKLAARGNVGENLTLRVQTNAATISLTITSTGASQIISGGKTFTATGIDVIPMGGTSVDVELVAASETERIVVSSIVPGSTFVADNSNLIRCSVALRTNLDPLQNTIPASELEFQMYYPEDVGDMFKYVSDEWPVTYQAGYSDEMSSIRHFYLADSPVYENHVITIRAKDQVEKLDITVKEGALFAGKGNKALVALHDSYAWVAAIGSWLKEAGVIYERGAYIWPFYEFTSTLINNKEGTLRELMGYQMNVSPFSYVDAGRPTFDFQNSSWAIYEEDLASIVEEKALNLSKIKAPSEEEAYDVRLGLSNVATTSVEQDFNTGAILTINPPQKLGKIIDIGGHSLMSYTPSEVVMTATKSGTEAYVTGNALAQSVGEKEYLNPNGMGGEEVTLEQLIQGQVLDRDYHTSPFSQLVFSPQNIFERKRDKFSFTFKGDPRWQPRDYLTVRRLDSSSLFLRLEEIHIIHEGGGTSATVVARHTDDPLT